MPENVLDHSKIIEAIKTPLGFFSLIVLVIEALLGGIALATDAREDRMLIIQYIIGILVLMIIIVTLISLFRPEALWGERYVPLDDIFAVGLAEEFHAVFDGYLRNMSEEARREAYKLFEESMVSSPHIHTTEARKFSKKLVAHLINRAKL